MTGDLKKKLIDSVWSGLSAIYNTATGANDVSAEEKVNEAVQQKIQEEEALDSVNPKQIDSLLNQGCRIDYVLQEAPYESFNGYISDLNIWTDAKNVKEMKYFTSDCKAIPNPDLIDWNVWSSRSK